MSTFAPSQVQQIRDYKNYLKWALDQSGLKPYLIPYHTIVAGGAAYAYFNNLEEVGFDIFCLKGNEGDGSAVSIRMLIQHLMERKDFDYTDHYVPNDTCPLSKNIYAGACQRGSYKIASSNFRIDFCFTNFETRKDLIDHLDFVHTTPAYEFQGPNNKDGQLTITQNAFEAIVNKTLIINPSGKREVTQHRVNYLIGKGMILP